MRKHKRHWRLYFVGGFFVLITLVLWARLVQVQIFGGARYKDIAENQWRVSKEVTPIRGAIFDRNGRPLALSIRSCSVSIRPQEVENADKVVATLSKRLDVPRRNLREKLRSQRTFVWVKRRCLLSDRERSEIKALSGVELHWEADRIYPFGATAAKVVGFVGHDNKGMAGIEAAFDEDLAGVPGWEVVQRDGAYRSQGYHTYAQKQPTDGKHVVLTIDAVLQEVAEMELEQAVRSTGAKGGGIIVMECETGEIMALAESPAARSRGRESLVDSLWTIRSVSFAYEPGSTFKLVTAAALLETEKVHSFDVFDAGNGRAVIGSAVISDSHPHGHLTFREGFILSSNIVMAQASLGLKPIDFFKFIRHFGFGAKTNLGILGESAGRVAPIEEWSDRTQITMAFGQEIAVTPLQMVNAFSAIANDGVLMVPIIVKSVVDEKAGEVEISEPVKIRSVVSKETADRLKAFCRSVVEDGTGTKANLPYLAVAGKTGTAEKAIPNVGYMPGKFIASFIGFAPYEDPKIACLVMLDEPNYENRFGGVSAAPVFARMNEAISNSSDLFDGVLTNDVLGIGSTARAVFKTPNFLRLDRTRAMERARTLELNVLCKGEVGEVVAQEPDPGVPMERDEVVRLYLSGQFSADGEKQTPDLRGLSLRMAKRRAVEAGLRCEIVGTGIVASQRPAPGKRSKSGVVKIFCKNKADEQLKG